MRHTLPSVHAALNVHAAYTQGIHIRASATHPVNFQGASGVLKRWVIPASK